MGGGKFDQNQCKVQLKLAISRLKLQKNKKDNQMKDQKREIAELLKAGKDESARIKVEGVIREDFIIEAYEILELFCELILARLGVIQISKECPPDIREAVCTLIYAAPRTDIKELSAIRQMLIIRFGKELGMDAVSNRDNCVNARIVHKLSIQTPENYLVFQYLNEIARMYNLEWKAEYVPEPIKIEPLPVAQPMFPDPPKSVSTMGPGSFPAFPTPPSTQGIPNFPSPPTTRGSVPDFPSPPSGNNRASFPEFPSPPVIPTFNPQAMPGGSYVPNFPDFPSAPSNQGGGIPNFPSPPSSSSSSRGSIPDFPSPPSSSSPSTRGSIPDFPSPPSFSGGGSKFPDFPSPPSSSSPSSTMNKGTLGFDFPSPPSSSSPSSTMNKGSLGFDFPSPPSSSLPSSSNSGGGLTFPSPPGNDSNSSSTVPDFDELTARFEKLKKRDS